MGTREAAQSTKSLIDCFAGGRAMSGSGEARAGCAGGFARPGGKWALEKQPGTQTRPHGRNRTNDPSRNLDPGGRGARVGTRL